MTSVTHLPSIPRRGAFGAPAWCRAHVGGTTSVSHGRDPRPRAARLMGVRAFARAQFRESPRSVSREVVPDMTTPDQQAGSAVRPFTVQIPKDALDDLRRRLAATRWSTRELVGDRSQ